MPTLEDVKRQVAHLDGPSRFLAAREIKELPNILWADELIERVAQGYYGTHSGIIAATNKRILFVEKGMFKLYVEDFPYEKVSSIQYETGLLYGKITIFASGNRAEITKVSKDLARLFAESVRARITGPLAPASERASAANTGRLEALERLARLRDSGALSESEFTAEKERVLGS